MTTPTGGRCAVTVQAPSATIASGGGTAAITVDTARECQWTATAEASWLTLVSGNSGQGAGSLQFSAAPNRTTAPRTGSIAVNGERAQISQEAGTCNISVAPTTLSAAAGGSELHITVTTQDFCTWTAVSRVSWIVITPSGNGTGTADITIGATANTGPARTGTVDIGGTSVVVSQAAAAQGCTYAIAPSAMSASATGESTTVAVTASANCPWAAISEDTWIAVRAGASGSGNGAVTLEVLSNSGPSRTGLVTIAGKTFTITQAAATAPLCTYSVSPATITPPAAGGPSTLTVTAGAGCSWTLAGAPSWIAVSGGTGSGNGTVNLTVSANTGAARAATLTLGGQSISVTQAAAGATCAYTLNPTSLSPTAAGGSSPVAVTTTAGCTWTTTGAPAWITVTGGSGTGNGSVTLAVAANTGAARSATLTIAGQAFVVTQAAAGPTCTYAINPTSNNPTAAGGSTTVAVTTTAGCAWTTSGAPAWITVTGGSGTGNGSVTVAVAANTGASRTATLTIAGQSYTVTQAAACSYNINPNSFNPSAAGGSTAVAVTTSAGCAWTTSSPPAWITVTGGSGTGNGSVTVAAAANTGPARTATLTIAGQSFAVTQASGCTYSINPTSYAAPVAGGSTTVAVTTSAGCTWTTTGAPAWITVTGGSGTGNGSVTVTVAANTGGARNDTLTIAGQTFTVTQPKS